MVAQLQMLAESVIAGWRADAERQTREALAAGVSPQSILADGLIAPMAEVGARFERGEFYVPEMLIAARAMQAGLAVLKPYLAQGGIVMRGKVVIGTVKGDLHDIGKNLVSMMLQGGGFEVVDLGTDVSAEKFVQAAQEKKAAVVALSALLTTTMPQMANVVKALKEAGLGGKIKTMIGGAPVTQNFCDEIGADGYAPDAASAVDKAKALTK